MKRQVAARSGRVLTPNIVLKQRHWRQTAELAATSDPAPGVWAVLGMQADPLAPQLLRDEAGSFAHYLSAALIVRDEGRYLREWLEYHALLGVSHFYVYDNQSRDDTQAILAPYVASCMVELRCVAGRQMRIAAWLDAVMRSREQTFFLALLNADEFLVPMAGSNIPELLHDYEEYPGIGVNVRSFDCNDHERRPTGLTGECYTRVLANPDSAAGLYAEAPDLAVRSIVNPRWVVALPDACHALYRGGRLAVTENFEPLPEGRSARHSAHILRVNHYFSRSVEDFMDKIARGDGDGRREHYLSPQGMARLRFAGPTAQDTAIQRFLPQLRARLARSCTTPPRSPRWQRVSRRRGMNNAYYAPQRGSGQPVLSVRLCPGLWPRAPLQGVYRYQRYPGALCPRSAA